MTRLASARAPRWADEARTIIDLFVSWEGMAGEIPFTASPNDVEQHGREIFAAAIAGAFGDVGPFQPAADAAPESDA